MIRKLNEYVDTTDLQLSEEICRIIYNNGFDTLNEREVDSLVLDVLDNNGNGSYVEIKSKQTGLIYRLVYLTRDPGHFHIDPPCKLTLGEKSIFKDMADLKNILSELSLLNL